MNRLSLLTLFTTILLLAPGTANSPAPSTSGTRVADGCIPTGPSSCKPRGRERRQLADGPGCIPDGPNTCKPGARERQQLADGPDCIPTSPTNCFPKLWFHDRSTSQVRQPHEMADGPDCIPDGQPGTCRPRGQS